MASPEKEDGGRSGRDQQAEEDCGAKGVSELIREEKEHNLFLLMASVVSVNAEPIPL